MLKQIFNCSCLFFTLAILIIIVKYIFQTTREGWRDKSRDFWGKDERRGRRQNCSAASSNMKKYQLRNQAKAIFQKMQFTRDWKEKRQMRWDLWKIYWKLRQHFIDSQYCRKNRKWYYVYSWPARRWVMARELRARSGKPYLVYWSGRWKYMWKPPNKWIYSAIRWRTDR